MPDIDSIERQWRHERNVRAVQLGLSFLFASVAWGFVAYLAYTIPIEMRASYEILLRDYEWRRARIESPYRELQQTLQDRNAPAPAPAGGGPTSQ